MIQQRNSSVELLRLISIAGIVSLHSFVFFNNISGINRIYGVVINTIFNMGVSIFMLISGYYGMKFSIEKFLKLELMTIFYSVLGLGVNVNELSFEMVLQAFFPVVTRKYWFLSVYMVMFILSKYINMIPEKLDKKNFQYLLGLLLLIFGVIPTIFHYHIMRDNGKGVMNMLLIYLIGCYIRKYYSEFNYSKKRLVTSLLIIVSIGIFINYATSLIFQDSGLFCPFTREYSLLIIAGAIIVFLLFLKIEFTSVIVNRLAKGVFAIYVFEGTVRTILDRYFMGWEPYRNEWYLFAVSAVYVLVVMAICGIAEFFRQLFLGKFEKKIISACCKKWDSLQSYIK